MKKFLSIIIVILVFTSVGCNQKKSVVAPPLMQTSADSMSYVVGLNLGKNLMELDSLLNIKVVCEGIRDAYSSEQKLNDEQARAAYLKYMNYDVYERAKKFETQFLADLRKQDRKFVATTSGLTYKVHILGDMKKTIRSNRDTIHMCYRVLDLAGNVVDTTYYKQDTLRIGVGSMQRGVIEASKLIGEGGHMEAWVPSTLAFGSAGCDSLNVKPNTMLYYELWLIDVEKK